MQYQTFDPSPDLSPFIKCYWTLESPKEAQPEKQTIVPDGCLELIFHYGDFYKQYLENGSYLIQPKCFVIGQLTQPLEIEATGASVFDGGKLQSEIAQVSGDGASLIQTWTTKRIEGDLDGASKLKLKGNPIQSEMEVDGASSIEKL